MLILLLSLFASAQLCTPGFGKQNPGGDWNFSVKQEPGMVPVEGCIEQANFKDLVLSRGMYRVDAVKKAARLQAEAEAEKTAAAKEARKEALKAKERLTDEERDEVLKMLLENK